MPALKPTPYTATITWLGASLAVNDSLRAETAQSLELGFAGIPGGRHEGLTRPSCSRVLAQHPRGTEIANVRQVTILSDEELALIAADCGLDQLDPAYLGSSIVVRGIGDFSHVPPSSRLQAENGTTMVIDMENRPCVLPGRELEADFPGHGTAFKAAAEGRRGVTAWIERPGRLTVGDKLHLHIPDQPQWKMPTE